MEAGKHDPREAHFEAWELVELETLASEKKEVVLVEAITNQSFENYQGIKEASQKIGALKITECNYSQYSSRHDAFKEGTILPAFDPKKAYGGAFDGYQYLQHIHLVVDCLVNQKTFATLANIERDIDTSTLLLDYGDVKVVCIGAEGFTSDHSLNHSRTEGSVVVNGPTNTLDSYTTEKLQVKKRPLIAKIIHTACLMSLNSLAAIDKMIKHL